MTSFVGKFRAVRRIPWGAICAVATWGPGAAAEVRPAACFTSHMVIEQGMPLPVWGTADPGEQVVVEFAGARAETTADAAGRWRTSLPPQQASREPRPLVITAVGGAVTLDDVLVGEVWLCAGQSNMLLPLARAAEAKREIAAATQPLVRLFQWQAAAGGDRGAYSAEQVAALDPGRFGAGSWARCTPETAAGFSAVGYCFGTRLAVALDVPVGIVCVAVGGTPTEAWVGRAALAADDRTRPLVTGDWLANPALAGWCVERARDNLSRGRRAGERLPGDDLGPNHPFKPGFLWEAGIAPLVPLAIRGVCWYQGESNADSPARAAQHEAILPVLVADWRRAWDRELPFGIVQLPGMGRPDWPAFRDGQRRLAEAIPGTGLVVTIDLGDPREVHPADKRPIGERLAAWALADVYGRAGPATGPRPQGASREPDGSVRVAFTATGGGLATRDGAAPVLVEVAGAEGRFQPAAARIDGETLVIMSAAGPPPGEIKKIRHAWRPFPEPKPNLTGRTGLPATPFELEVE
jgi:sialate O-acetylesterase